MTRRPANRNGNRYSVKDWPRFQHYRGRRPPWIKLYRDLLDNFEYLTMQTASVALAPLLWLLASESEDGTFTADCERLAFRLHRPADEITTALQELEQRGFILISAQGASTSLARCKHLATPETEIETERETETETEIEETDGASPAAPAPPTGKRSRQPFKKPILEELQAHCQEKGYTFDPEQFLAFYESKGWRVGTAPMRSWQAACVTWQKREGTHPSRLATRPPVGKGRTPRWHPDDVPWQQHGEHPRFEAFWEWCCQQPGDGQWPRFADWLKEHGEEA